MPITKPEINLRLFDETALDDSTYSTLDKQPFVDLSQLKISFDEPSQYATLETDQWLLDGSKEIFPDDMSTLDFGFWSLSQSDALGQLNVPFSINFGSVHSTLGVTIIFYDEDYSTDIDISWYDFSDALIVSKNFLNDTPVFYADESVADYKRIEITFNKTNKPGRYVKMKEIGFGADIIFSSKEVKTCNILEELSTTSEELSINTMDVKVFVEDSVLVQNIYQVLQEQQKLIVSAYINGVKKPYGTFYLKTRSNPSENEIIFKTEDLLGVLDGETYKGGFFNDTVQNIMDDIMLSYGTNSYTVSDDIKDLVVTGYIPITTFRRAIQLLAFSVNAVVDCSRDNKVNMYRLEEVSPSAITKSNYFQKTQQKELPKYTSIALEIETRLLTNERIEGHKATYTSGSYIVEFNEPLASLQITNGSFIITGSNYCEFSTTGGEVIITGLKYNKSKTIFIKQKPNIPLNAVLKEKKYKNTLVWNGQTNVDYLYSKMIDKSEKEAKIILPEIDVKVGSFVDIDSLYNKQIEGYIESIDLDLANGIIGLTKIVGDII